MASLEVVRHRPHPSLAGLVAGIVGFDERADGMVERRQMAGSLLPLVLSFGDPLDVSLAEGAGRYSSFVAGFMSAPTTTRFVGAQRCVQVYLTPLGALRLLGLPGRELAGRVADVDAVAPVLGGSLPERLAEAPTWVVRTGLVEEALLALLATDSAAEPLVAWMWDRIIGSGGRARIHDLVAETGWSHRHVVTRFKDQIGLSPKAAAGIVRFERAAADLGRRPLAEIAAQYGYADQSHLTREVVRYSGEPPGALVAARRPTAYTALGRRPSSPQGGRWSHRGSPGEFGRHQNETKQA